MTDPSTEPVVVARDLWRTHGRGPRAHDVLRGTELTALPGEIIGIVGRSGCGKSTLLRILAGLERPDRGSVFWNPGTRAGRPAPGSVAAVFQDAAGSLDPNWSIARSVAEPLARRLTRQARRAAVLEALRSVGLGDLDPSLRPARLSGGQCQRVALARAFAARPGLLLADEPTSALDASAAAAILRLLRRAADSGTAVVLVTHDRDAAAALTTRLLGMSDGVLTHIG
ncbi:ABC transporter ATP-binding protein [Streptodolium elevatio]|uniref:ATP-binding cassette domain-containing protein n=1 Tax=Streptodolium elevatio TaxID=3157996 RepID=A0ABV3DCF9_9ACTN